MARYVMTNRRARRTSREARRNSRAAMARAMTSDVMGNAALFADNRGERDSTRQVLIFDVDAEEEEIRRRSEEFGDDVIVEKEILHYTDGSRPIELLGYSRDTLVGDVSHASTTSFRVTVSGNGSRLPYSRVALYLRSGTTDRYVSKAASRRGVARFRFASHYSVSSVVVEPVDRFWPMTVRRPRSGQVVDCPPLPAARNNRGWWHDCVNIRRFNKTRGRGIKVGVIDTGLGMHPGLAHCRNVGAYINGLHLPQDGADVGFHGTHVCGIIAARPGSGDRTWYGGVAPGVRLSAARVFPAGANANQADIAAAIDALSQEHKVDLINLSLGAREPSDIEHDAIIDAADHGTLCVCAAANSNGAVEYPAAFPETLAISAIGLEGWGPVGSLASQRLPWERKRFGSHGYYHASFSCYGAEIDGAAPGVGIISTVPGGVGRSAPYAAADGTSMACPIACGALAALLAKDNVYRGMPRDRARMEHAKSLFDVSCQHIGLPSAYEGRGVPKAI